MSLFWCFLGIGPYIASGQPLYEMLGEYQATGRFWEWAFCLLTVTPLNLTWVALLYYRFRPRAGQRVEGYLVRHDTDRVSLVRDGYPDWSSYVLLVPGGICVSMSGLGLVMAGLGWTLFFGLAWRLARTEKLEPSREKYVVRPGLVVLPGGQRVPRAELVELRLSLSQRRNSLCLVGGHPYSLGGGEKLGLWLSQQLSIPLLVSSEPEPKQFSYPSAYPRGVPRACFNPTPLLFGVATAVALCAVGGDPRNLSYWFALAMLGTILYQILQESEDDCRIILLYRHRVINSDTFLSGWALARNCTRLDALAGWAGVKSLSQDGFPDPLRDQKVVWRPASDGLVTVEALIRAVRNQPASVDDSALVLLELERLRQGLRAAQDQDTPFSWLIEHGSVTSALVWERRGGHP